MSPSTPEPARSKPEAADALAALADAVAMERTQRVQRTDMAVELYQQIETLYRGRGQLENALESVQMAITVLPGQHEFLLRRAWLLLELGRFDEALEGGQVEHHTHGQFGFRAGDDTANGIYIRHDIAVPAHQPCAVWRRLNPLGPE